MKKKLLLAALIVMCLAILATGTIAYFTSEDTAHNVITTNGVDIELLEWQEDENGELVPYPDEPISAMPGVTVSKVVEIENLAAEAYVRARFDVVILDAEGKEMNLTSDRLAEVVEIAVDGEVWQRKEGDTADWWYYNEAVPGGGKTEPLFTQVSFNGPKMTNEFQGSTVTVIVHAQGVQTANNGESVLEASGWPED